MDVPSYAVRKTREIKKSISGTDIDCAEISTRPNYQNSLTTVHENQIFHRQ